LPPIIGESIIGAPLMMMQNRHLTPSAVKKYIILKLNMVYVSHSDTNHSLKYRKFQNGSKPFQTQLIIILTIIKPQILHKQNWLRFLFAAALKATALKQQI